ncbi:type II CRISPR-associated endonuclease Cas1 [Persicobacter psychrovividus]|uniref:CRISPR-associated endonuclease Cas1 n=1 Tax=Persicobacter psychrovividus TaxID=387638 RepID=A0ABN6LH60_9BACT|nr:CRISPR-associated endonuclease Cas1 [Persicobacter psychrovividus]
MIKRTLYFGNACRLNVQLGQLQATYPEAVGKASKKVPVEDIGLVVIDHPQVSITHGLSNALIANNAAMLWCNEKHMPHGMLLPFESNQTFTEKLHRQIAVAQPLKKQLWKQTIQSKIQNQAVVLEVFGHCPQPLIRWAEEVKSGDTDNKEARAAAYYWSKLLGPYGVGRGREAGPPNALFNYGYAVLRAIIARSLVSSGCHPSLGIFHKNKYNPFCLADDVMEPYRPFVDAWIFQYLQELEGILPGEELTQGDKIRLLEIPTLDVQISDKISPLMVASQRTTASLMRCYEGDEKQILYPQFQ